MKECLVCNDDVTIVCQFCKNEYCDIHYHWHFRTRKECRKQYEKLNAIKIEEETNENIIM